MPSEANPIGTVFGGWVLAQMDLAGGNHAFLRAQGLVTTVAVEGMEFHLPVMVGDEFTCYTEIVRIGTTSLSIRVQAWVRRGCIEPFQTLVTSAVFTFVALTKERTKRPVPPEIPTID
jgi:acyl-CoA thioesterase YciA